MSVSDPYAAPDAPHVEEAKTSVAAPTEAPVEAPAGPVTEEQTVPEGSIKDVLSWVGEDATKAQSALDAETAGDNRKTLVKELNAILDK